MTFKTIKTSGPLYYVEQESGGYEVTRDAWVELPFDVGECEYYDRQGRCVLRIVKTFGKPVLWLLKGLEWNGASGPTVDTADTMWPSSAHDAGAKLTRSGDVPPYLVPSWDRLIRDMLIDRAETDRSWIRRQIRKGRAWTWFAFLRTPFGTEAAARRRKEKDDVEKSAA